MRLCSCCLGMDCFDVAMQNMVNSEVFIRCMHEFWSAPASYGDASSGAGEGIPQQQPVALVQVLILKDDRSQKMIYLEVLFWRATRCMKFGRQVVHGKWLQVQELSLGCSTLPELPELEKELFLPHRCKTTPQVCIWCLGMRA